MKNLTHSATDGFTRRSNIYANPGTDGFTRRSNIYANPGTDGFTRRSSTTPIPAFPQSGEGDSGTNGFTRLIASISFRRVNPSVLSFLPVLCLLLGNAIAAFAQDGPIKVMTFNIRFDNPADGINSWENRRAFVAENLNMISPDIIGMQEALERQCVYLKENLRGYDYRGTGRDDGMTGGEYSPVFFRADRFSVMDWGTFWLSSTPSDTGSVGWDAALTRICTWVKFAEKASGNQFFYLNTHFDHMGKTARIESAKLILDYINKDAKALPVILTGDFNSSPSGEPYRILTKVDIGLADACMKVGGKCSCSEGTFNGFGSEQNPERIDFVYYRGRWEATSYEVLKIMNGDMFISDHWPVMAVLESNQSAVGSQQSGLKYLGDTTIVQTFTFDSIVTRRAEFQFPDDGKRYEKILMYYTLKCDSLTPHDKYPCGEWDYTTYTRVYKHTGKMDSVKYQQPGFVVKGKSPKVYIYSESPTYTYYQYYEEEKRGSGESPVRDDSMVGGEAWGRGGMEYMGIDHFARFEGADYIEVQGEAFKDVRDEITVSFWLCGDPFHQPMASTIFEGLDKDGKRVVNLHVPYDNGVVYWDAGGHGEGLTDNINKAASPLDYKGRWTHWAVTKNSKTGEQSIYMNGKLFLKGTNLNRPMDGISTFRIGSNGNGSGKFYQGSIDDFTVWGRELDSLEIESLANKMPGDYPKSGLLICFDFNDISKIPVIPDISGHGFSGASFGNPGFIAYNSLPYSGLKPVNGQVMQRDSIPNPMVSIVIYGDSLRPDLPTDTMSVWPGHNYYCNSQGIVVDSASTADAKVLRRKTRSWYGKPFEIIEPFEIGRFITPYGKRLDLGLNGFTWVYDVTDYEPLLHGKVDLQAANGQELIDLKFIFIEGVPPRDVISVRNIWPEGSYVYQELADDEVLQATSLRLQANASSFKLRARISGHGEKGPLSCCEWDPKMHSFIVNDENGFDWKVWRDCGMNPVYPQGGTWQFDRAGWCPGTFVDTYDFEITPFVVPGETATIDYMVQPYDPDNGEEEGNFEMAMHLFEYSAPNYHLELELNDILAPSQRQEYRRLNPVSLNPVIRVKNNGTDTVSKFIMDYGIEGNEPSSYAWSGKLGFMQSADIILPKPSWQGVSPCSRFTVVIKTVNDKKDEQESNNAMASSVEAPVILPSEFIIHVKTQGFGRAADNAYTITDAKGSVVSERLVYEDTTLCQDLVRLNPGAYNFTFTDKNEDGMIRHWWLYWEDPDKVGENGELKILDAEKKELINLGYDFAEKKTLQFFVGEPK